MDVTREITAVLRGVTGTDGNVYSVAVYSDDTCGILQGGEPIGCVFWPLAAMDRCRSTMMRLAGIPATKPAGEDGSPPAASGREANDGPDDAPPPQIYHAA